MRRLRWSLFAPAALIFLSACAAKGDFGRNPPAPQSDLFAWLRPIVAPITAPITEKKSAKAKPGDQLTDEEQRLRDLARNLTVTPQDRDNWTDVVGKLSFVSEPRRKTKPPTYAERLFKTAYRSQTARYNKLIEDIRNDIVQLDPFFAVANYVADMDRKREKSFDYISRVTPEERKRALKRIAENHAVVQSVQRAMAERAAAYKVALDRLVIAAPSPVAIEAERSLNLLQQRIGAYSS